MRNEAKYQNQVQLLTVDDLEHGKCYWVAQSFGDFDKMPDCEMYVCIRVEICWDKKGIVFLNNGNFFYDQEIPMYRFLPARVKLVSDNC